MTTKINYLKSANAVLALLSAAADKETNQHTKLQLLAEIGNISSSLVIAEHLARMAECSESKINWRYTPDDD